jgi:hypothetical protein
MKVDKHGLRFISRSRPRVSLGRIGPHDDDTPAATAAGAAQEADMAKVPSSVVAAGGLVGGYGVARWTRKRQLGGAVLAVAGAAAAQQWRQQAGGKAAGALTAGYVAAFAGSHPLAKKVGAWPAVFGVAGAVALASWAVADRRG